MHRSGINVDNELRDAFNAAAADEGVQFLKIGISDEKFAIDHRGAPAGSPEADFAAVAAALTAGQPSFVALKHGEGWVLASYVPEDSPVRQKMLFASSRAALKEGLARPFVDFFVSDLAEVSVAEFKRSLEEHKGSKDDLMTDNEIAKRDAHHSSLREQGGGSTQSAMSDLPLAVDDTVTASVEQFKAGAASAVFLRLDLASEKLHAEESKESTPEGVAAALATSEPRYVLFRYAHSHNGKEATSVLFVFNCPDACKPRDKMVSASFRGMVQRFVEANGVAVDKSLEVTTAAELTAAAVNDELYPGEVKEKKFAKPTRPGRPAAGRGRRRMHGNVKFSAE